ncbi:hypothetical protein BDP27DRAFT_1337390 [Rhodocollybia butyracea]|uniref:F-box domain-containing protein n=1 Tax=Rhodocollybia butyracea TaxID=206335 RepID=A0A9P5U0J4_9AGAR|nr:hypothetical protein BDP27DRAFT_1337390 [Rhodocollybia butyracea]
MAPFKSNMSCETLLDLPDDVLIHLLTFFSVPEILSIRQTCRHLEETTNLTIVWINALETHISRKGLPFPMLEDFTGRKRVTAQPILRPELELRTRRAYRLAKSWLSTSSGIHRDISWINSPSIPITDVRFIRSVRRCSHPDIKYDMENVLVLSVSKGIWSVITIWAVPLSLHGSDATKSRARKCAQWSPKGGLFTGLCLSHENDSEADVAISLVCEGRHEIKLFKISDEGELALICTIPSFPWERTWIFFSDEDSLRLQAMRPMKPVTYQETCTVVYNYQTGAFAVLGHEDEAGVFKQDHIIQVVFAYRSILVVRARSIHLFPAPELCVAPPIDSSTPFELPPKKLDILHSLDLYELSLDENVIAIQSPEQGVDINSEDASTALISTRGSLRCTDLALGKCRTAIWVKPGDRASHGLLTSDVYHDYTYIARLGGLTSSGVPSAADLEGRAAESLVAGIFPGPLNPDDEVRTRRIYMNPWNNWTALDYDEANGRVVLGDAVGGIRILEL